MQGLTLQTTSIRRHNSLERADAALHKRVPVREDVLGRARYRGTFLKSLGRNPFAFTVDLSAHRYMA
ncbi:MAG: hypothetical protein ACJARS_004724 [bacterium]